MKRSIKRLPKSTQEELNYLVESIIRHIPKCAMIVLYGSYARGGYVLWDERIEFGIHTSYQSDLDILVLTYNSSARITEGQLEEKVVRNYHKAFASRRHAAPQFIVEDINSFNKSLDQRRYFYTDIVKEGIKLYDDKKFKLMKPHALSFKEIKNIAEEEFNKCYPFAIGFMKYAYIALEDEMNELGAFQLHQACERFYYSIELVFVNYRPKSHKLKDLESKCKKYSRDIATVFLHNTEFEKHCYDLLCRAYIESRYNKDYVVTREELAYMLQRAEILKKITYTVCSERLLAYDSMSDTENQKFTEVYQTTERKDIPTLAADELEDSKNDPEENDMCGNDFKENSSERK
ncbi:HEPN domain-containing protein [Bacteroides sp.]|uniref:HEPN domain-containing protein n=1 Tax=Bacteroides sp. TaxID=29523 RepID=UPI00345DFDCF